MNHAISYYVKHIFVYFLLLKSKIRKWLNNGVENLGYKNESL